MASRSDQADAYAARAVQGDPGTPWIVDHGGDVTTDDVRAVAEEAFAAGWDAVAEEAFQAGWDAACAQVRAVIG